MNSSYLKTVVATMRNKGIECAPGLTAAEIEAAETEHGFRFPADLRALLAHVLPVGERFPDWRLPRSAFICDRLAWPADSICFDIEHDAFWFPAWGHRPNSIEKAQAIAREAIRKQPFLIPIYAHRYLPGIAV
jgi:hypothetical protein